MGLGQGLVLWVGFFWGGCFCFLGGKGGGGDTKSTRFATKQPVFINITRMNTAVTLTLTMLNFALKGPIKTKNA